MGASTTGCIERYVALKNSGSVSGHPLASLRGEEAKIRVLIATSYLWNLLTIPGSMQTILWYSSSSKSAKLCATEHQQRRKKEKEGPNISISGKIKRRCIPGKKKREKDVYHEEFEIFDIARDLVSEEARDNGRSNQASTFSQRSRMAQRSSKATCYSNGNLTCTFIQDAFTCV